ncbi:MAG: peptidoglycan recognition protein family protein [Acidimicrobiales bacterium]
MTTYLARSAWTSTTASGATLTGVLLRGVAVHWPGTSQDRIGDPGQAAIAERLRHYRDYHMGTKGWQDIGYNLAIDQAGRVWILRSTKLAGNMVGAHCASKSNPDANREYVGVLLLLGDQEPLSDAMIEAFRDWYHTWFLPGWPNRRDVRGHGQVAGAQTECPGHYARAVMGELTTPNQEDDMYTQADRDAEAARYKDLAHRLGVLIDSEADRYQVYTHRYEDLVRRLTELADLVKASPGLDEVALAAALAALLPAVDQADLEAALRTVLGSVDE